MRKYHIRATRTTYYEILADSADDAENRLDEAKEVDQQTREIVACAVCPTCDDPLTDRAVTFRTTADGQQTEEPSYCDTCDQEVTDEDYEHLEGSRG